MTVMRGSKRTRRGDKRIVLYVEMKQTLTKERGVRGRINKEVEKARTRWNQVKREEEMKEENYDEEVREEDHNVCEDEGRKYKKRKRKEEEVETGREKSEDSRSLA